MDKDKTHGIDAHIPSDTEKFDNKANEAKGKEMAKKLSVSPELEELNMKFSLLTSRVSAFAGFYIDNEKNGLGLASLSILNHVQTMIGNCAQNAFVELLKEKLNKLSICFKEYADASIEDKFLSLEERLETRKEAFKKAANALGTTDTELMERTVKQVEEHLKSLQEQFNISITSEGVTVHERKEAAPAATSKPGPTDQQSGA